MATQESVQRMHAANEAQLLQEKKRFEKVTKNLRAEDYRFLAEVALNLKALRAVFYSFIG